MEKTLGRRRSSRVRGASRKTGVAGVDLPTCGFLLAAVAFGGAGINSPFAHALIVVLGLLVLAIRLPRLDWQSADARVRYVAWLFLAAAALGLLQIVPLPQSLWASLPGHQLAGEIATAVGGGGWRAWSLSPDRTLESMTALVPPAAGVLIALQASSEQRRAILRFILLVALASAMLAIIQISAGPGSAPVLFATRHRGLGVGLFVNRNHFALFLLLAMQIAALPGIPTLAGKRSAAAAERQSTEWALRSGALVLLSLGVLATLSRAGAFLLPVALVAAVLINRRGRLKGRVVLIGIVVAALLALALSAAPPVQALLERYTTAAEDKRFDYWANTILAVRDALPIGTGFGTFTLIYPTVEPLAQLRPDVVNHAHNDLLELALEGGLPGLALLVAWLALIVMLVIRARGVAQSRRERLLPVVVAVGVGLTLAASVVDYPIRMDAIAVVLALLVGMLLPMAQDTPAVAGRPARRWLIVVPLALLGLFTVTAQAARQFATKGGAALAPWASQVQADAATRFQFLNDPAQSSRAARRALAVSPLDAQAVRAEGMAALALGRREQGAQLLSLGGRLGWRDGFNQLWLIEQALAAGADAYAIQRMDGLIRQLKFGDALLPLMPPLLRTPEGTAAVVEQLAQQPGWRVAFFNALARDKGTTTAQVADLAARLRKAGTPLTPADTMLLRAVLAEQGRFADVRRVWRESGQGVLLGDGEFDVRAGELPLGAAPYEWMAGQLSGVRVEVAQAEAVRKGQAVAITSQGLGAGPALAQTIVLTPGRYTLAFSASAEQAEDAARSLTAMVVCRRATGQSLGQPIAVPLTWGAGRQQGWSTATGSFVVPGDCPGQTLMVAIPQTGGRPFSLWLDGVSIRSAG